MFTLMSFLHPTLITGPLLLLLGVPVLIHLIHLLRHRRVQWAAMQFLQQSALRYRKWILFRQSALLLVRIAAVAALLMMLAQPVLQSPWGRLLGGDRTHHVVLLDDSFSMSDQGPTGRVFDLGKRFLVQLTGKLLEQDGTHKLSLLRFSRAVEPSAGPRFDVVQERVDRALYVQLERMLKATDVSQLAVGPAAALRVVARQPRLADDAARIVYLVSDFRTNEWRDATEQRAILAELQRTGARIQLVACADTQRANLAISSVRPATATRAAEVEMLMQVSVRHFGHTAARRVAVRLEQDGQSRPAVCWTKSAPTPPQPASSACNSRPLGNTP
ncbi:MAG: hypothetical protein A2W31_13885 [Planctomycetes bacterium RBG_16_64_10]|nr:MAG: hypothetical protein A2W31_13885 [Planctomycetes bacterium RBG_16_64_10]